MQAPTPWPLVCRTYWLQIKASSDARVDTFMPFFGNFDRSAPIHIMRDCKECAITQREDRKQTREPWPIAIEPGQILFPGCEHFATRNNMMASLGDELKGPYLERFQTISMLSGECLRDRPQLSLEMHLSARYQDGMSSNKHNNSLSGSVGWLWFVAKSVDYFSIGEDGKNRR